MFPSIFFFIYGGKEQNATGEGWNHVVTCRRHYGKYVGLGNDEEGVRDT